jgi:hypothetical protein
MRLILQKRRSSPSWRRGLHATFLAVEETPMTTATTVATATAAISILAQMRADSSPTPAKSSRPGG